MGNKTSDGKGGKVPKKFKKAGQGHSLQDPSPPRTSSGRGNYQPPKIGGNQPKPRNQATALAAMQKSMGKKKHKTLDSARITKAVDIVSGKSPKTTPQKKVVCGVTSIYDELSNKTFTTELAMHKHRAANFGIPVPKQFQAALARSESGHTSPYKYGQTSPSSAVGKAAEERLKGRKKKEKNKPAGMSERNFKMLFKGGLADNSPEQKAAPLSQSPRTGKAKRAEDIYMASGGASEAALKRMKSVGKKKKNILDRDGTERTRDLLYGDGLKTDAAKNVYKASDGSEFRSKTSRDEHNAELRLRKGSDALDALESIEAKLILFVNDSKPETVQGTAKTMLKLINNLEKASTVEEKTKFGKLRIENKAIKKKFVNVPHALDLLNLIGYKKAFDGTEEILAFKYTNENFEAIAFLRENILEWQEAASQG